MPPEIDGAGCLLLDGDGALRFAEASDTPAQVLEVAEELCVEGPCHEAFASADEVAYTDVATQNRWARLGTLLATSPVRGVIGVPVLHQGRPIGSLDAFSATPREWTDAHLSDLRQVAGAVSDLIATALERQDDGDDDLGRQLREALEHRHVLQEASETVALRSGAPVIQASLQLRHMAAAAGVSAVSLAYQIVERGGVPGPSELASEATKLRRRREEHARLALTDPLTGLTNRVLLLDRLQQALDRRTRDRSSPAVLLIDLDEFKAINDSLGHDAGDEVLRIVGGRLSDVVRPQDTASRLGGDEFVVLCDSVPDAEAALGVAGRVAEALSEPIFVEVDDQRGARRERVTMLASVGVALGVSDGARRPADLLREADVAMYSAKKSGQGIVLFSDQLREAGNRRARVEQTLREALRPDQGNRERVVELPDGLRLVYQPIVDLRTHDVRAVEAFPHWWDSALGEVPPRELVRTAEDAGLMGSLGDALLGEAVAATARWRRERPGKDLVLAVNVSPAQLLEPGFVDTLAATLSLNGLPPDRLSLEVTEPSLLQVTNSNVGVLHRLAHLGVRLSLDDVGSGYLSLAHLVRLPLHQLKIHPSFVAGLDHGRHDAAAAGAAVSLARSLELTTVGQGVETAVQAERLLVIGCDLAQGGLYGQATGPEAISRLLTRSDPS